MLFKMEKLLKIWINLVCNMIQKGDKVYIVPSDTRIKPYYATVKSIGRAYITVNGHPSYSRFSIYIHKSVPDRTGWDPQLTLYKSEEDYQIEQKIQNERCQLINNIKNKLTDATLGELKEIYKLMH